MDFDFSRRVAGRAWRAAGNFIAKLDAARAAKRLIVIPAMLTAAGLAIAQTAGPIQSTNLVSVSSDGFAGNTDSLRLALSADGRFIAFDSTADNLVPGDTNWNVDVFVHDYQNGTTERISTDSSGQQITDAIFPSISADGRYVAFVSNDTTLLPEGANSFSGGHAFLHDRQTGTTELVDMNDAGTVGDQYGYPFAVSGDGRYVLLISSSTNLVPDDTNGWEDIFVRDRQTGTIERVSVSDSGEQANSFSGHAAISSDGRFVAFVSAATNLVPGDTNGVEDVFVRDRLNGTTTRVNVNNAGEQALHTPPDTNMPYTYTQVAISADGRFVAFDSPATNLDPADTDENFGVFVRDRQTGTTELVSVDNAGVSIGGGQPTISGDGRFVVFGSLEGVVIRDRDAGTTELVSVTNAGEAIVGNDAFTTPIYRSAVSANGQFAAFSTSSVQLVPSSNQIPPYQMFLRSLGPTDGQTPSVSAGGPHTVNAGEPVTLAATGFDPNGDPLTYAWDFDNDGNFETPGRSVIFPTTGFTNSATYNVRVRVTDATGLTGTASTVVAIATTNVAPTISVSPAFGVDEGGSTALTAIGSDLNGDTLTYAWDLDNNGTFETPGQTVTFSAAGIDGPAWRSVGVQVADPDGLTATASTTVTINNVAPTADAGGPYVVNEGASVIVSATGTDPSSADAAALTYAWDLDNNGSFETPGKNVTYSAADIDGPAAVSVRVRVSDNDGGVSVDSATISIANAAPIASAGGPYMVDEGGSITLTASATDVAADTFTFAWDLDDNGIFETPGPSASFSAANLDGPATLNVRVQVTDDDGGSTIIPATITVNNVAPTVSAITAPVDPMPIGTVFNVSASFTEPAAADTHTAVWYWNGKQINGTISDGTVTGTDSLSGATVTDARLVVSDDDGGQGTSRFWYLVSYDPSVGMATGGGTIVSPSGGYTADPTASGVAQLGFFVRVPKGTGTPGGFVAYRFETAGIEFRSYRLTSMTVDRTRTTITGQGSINGQNYQFLLKLIDGDARGGDGVDRYRLKIHTAYTVVYDNEPGAADDADPVTPLQSGSIIVQRTGAKGS